MHDGSIVFNTKIDNSNVEKDLKELERKIRSSEDSISKNENTKLPLVKQAEQLGAKLDEAKRNLTYIQQEMTAVQAAMAPGSNPADYMAASADYERVKAALDAQEKEVRAQQREWDKLNGKIDNYNLKIQRSRQEIERNTAEAIRLQSQLTSSGAKMQAAFDKAHVSADRFGKRLMGIAKSALIFNVASAGLRVFVEYISKALKTNSEYTAQLAKLKGALLTAFQPIYDFILPGLLAIMRVLTAIVQVVANVLSGLSGKTAAQSAENAAALNKEANAIKSVGSAAKKAQKDLAGFDEINRLGGTDASGGSAAGSVSPDFSGFSTDEYKAKIDELTVYMSGALLALGAILAFSGANIPLGIALMAAGAVGLVSEIKENWGAMDEPLKKALTTTLGILGGALLAIGAILALSGASVPKGIALMAMGAAALAGTVAINWNTIEKALKGPIGKVVALVSAGLLALGAIIAFSGANIPLGVALMVAGAAGLVSVATVNWDTIQKSLQGPIGDVVRIASGALLALGLVLAFSGASLPLGIGLILAGAAGLATTIAANWETVQKNLEGPVGQVVAIGSSALLALGLVLAFSGAALPLGLALIAAGATGLVSLSTINWNTMQEKLSEAWSNIKRWFSTSVKPYLTKDYWVNKIFDGLRNALPESWKAAINSAIKIINSFITWVNKTLSFKVPPIKIAGETVFSGAELKLVNLPQIPYLAQGAVIPPNREFLAVLGDQTHGTNIEAPLSTIQEAVAIVMEDMVGSQVAGFEAVVSVLREILEAILGIEIDGETLAKAVENYQRKMAVVRGG